MITIKGTQTEAIIFAESIDSASEGLITALCNSCVASDSKIRIMPDVHAGKGCTIGTTMTIGSRVAPGLVGVDIGCGMSVTKLKIKKMELPKLDKLVQTEIPSGFAIRSKPHRYADLVDLEKLKCAKHVRIEKALNGIGSLGGGNHFIELDKGEDGYYLVIHSGSRHLGVEVERFYHELAYEYSKTEAPFELAFLSDQQLEDYLHDMKIVQEYASINRKAIADDIIKGMKFSEIDFFETVHNYIDLEHRILRKGAISAMSKERIIIPLNMRDGCLICEGRGNNDWNSSAPHGAGRLYSRSDTLSSFTLSQFKKEMKDVYSSSIDRDTLDESPMAYKDPQSIIDAITPTVIIKEQLKPVYNYKAGSKRGE